MARHRGAGRGATAVNERNVQVAETQVIRPSAGPYDGDTVDPDAARFAGTTDFGSLRVPLPPGGVVTVEPPGDGGTHALHVAVADGRLSVSALAAPKSSKLWSELAKEIDESLREGGARVRSFTGEWGRELHATTGPATSVFVGVDGPRWMLYGVATGPTAALAGLDQELRRMLRGTVVVRGGSPYPVRTVLPLTLPSELAPVADEPETAGAADSGRAPGSAGGPTSSGGESPGGPGSAGGPRSAASAPAPARPDPSTPQRARPTGPAAAGPVNGVSPQRPADRVEAAGPDSTVTEALPVVTPHRAGPRPTGTRTDPLPAVPPPPSQPPPVRPQTSQPPPSQPQPPPSQPPSPPPPSRPQVSPRQPSAPAAADARATPPGWFDRPSAPPTPGSTRRPHRYRPEPPDDLEQPPPAGSAQPATAGPGHPGGTRELGWPYSSPETAPQSAAEPEPSAPQSAGSQSGAREPAAPESAAPHSPERRPLDVPPARPRRGRRSTEPADDPGDRTPQTGWSSGGPSSPDPASRRRRAAHGGPRHAAPGSSDVDPSDRMPSDSYTSVSGSAGDPAAPDPGPPARSGSGSGLDDTATPPATDAIPPSAWTPPGGYDPIQPPVNGADQLGPTGPLDPIEAAGPAPAAGQRRTPRLPGPRPALEREENWAGPHRARRSGAGEPGEPPARRSRRTSTGRSGRHAAPEDPGPDAPPAPPPPPRGRHRRPE